MMAYNYTRVKLDPSITDNITVDSGERELIYTFHITGSITVVKLSGFSGNSNISYDSPDRFSIETSTEGCDYEIRINGTVNFLSKSGTGVENDFNESDKLTNLICTSSDSSKDAINNNNMLAPHTSSFTSTMITSSLEAIDCLAEGLPNSEEVANSSTLHSGFILLPEIKAESGSDFDEPYRSDHTETLLNNNSIARMSMDSDTVYFNEKRHSSSEHSTVCQNRPKGAPASVQAKGQNSPMSKVNSRNDIKLFHFTKKQLLSCALCGFTCTWKRALQSHVETHLSNTFDGRVQKTTLHQLIAKRPRRTFPCCLCQKIFKLPRQLSSHLRDCHFQDKIFLCSVCDFCCEHIGNLTEHVQDEHRNMSKYICSHCNDNFDTLDQLSHHNSVSHAEKKLLPCVLCSFVCSTANGMKEHTLTLHAQRDKSLDPFFCAFCEYASSKFDDLCKHQQSKHTDERPFLCSQCGASFKRKAILTLHQQTVHTDERSYQCSKCTYACKSRIALHSHMKKHLDIRPYACVYCELKFKTKSNLKGHITNKHSTARPFKCPCGTSFKVASSLKAHIKWKHSNITPLSCSLCSYTTKSVYLLKYHKIRIHTKEEPYNCPQCSYTCKLQSDLNGHIKKNHSNEASKQFQCEYCDFSTARKGYLKKHFVIRHTDENPFACLLCNAAFKTSARLKNHMRTHSNEKPHICDVCGHSTKTMACLKRHMVDKHSKLKPYACAQCKYACKRKAALNRHIRLRHKPRK